VLAVESSVVTAGLAVVVVVAELVVVVVVIPDTMVVVLACVTVLSCMRSTTVAATPSVVSRNTRSSSIAPAKVPAKWLPSAQAAPTCVAPHAAVSVCVFGGAAVVSN
jgi:hypothetical protein